MPSTPVSPEFEALDAAANQAGAIYRGLGVGIGLLSVMILTLALAPVALTLTNTFAMAVVKTAKVALMVLVIVAVAVAVFGPWRSRWTTLRKRAQALACEPHGAGVNPTGAQREPEVLLLDGCAGLRRLVDEQIGYNAITASKYHHVERTTMVVTYVCFGIAVVCAAADAISYGLTNSSPKLLLFGTVFLPGVVGILHGVNGFLGVSEQAFSCKLMENHLKQMRMVLDQLQEPGVMLHQEDALAGVRRELADVLARHDNLWAATVKIPTV